MQITMDRYEANWPMVEQGWRTMSRARAGCSPPAQEAIETYRAETGCIDQRPARLRRRPGWPAGGEDRQWRQRDPLQLPRRSGAGDPPWPFDRKATLIISTGRLHPGVKFAGMLQYDGDLNILTSLSGSRRSSRIR